MNTCRAAYIELKRISSIRHFLSLDATMTLMCSLHSKLDYCNSLLSGSPQYLTQLLQKVQNTAAQITRKALRVEHTSPLLCSHKNENQAQGLLCLVCYTDWHRSEDMSEFVNVYIPSRSLRSSSDSSTFTISCVRTKTCGQRSFAYQRPATWYDLLVDLRHANSLSTFKSALKTQPLTIRYRM